MPRHWRIDILSTDDEVTVLVERDGRFFDEAGFHPSEKNELLNYLSKTLQRIVKDVANKEEEPSNYVEDCEVADEDTEDIDGSVIQAGECIEVTR